MINPVLVIELLRQNVKLKIKTLYEIKTQNSHTVKSKTLAKRKIIETFIEIRMPAICLVPDRLVMPTTLQAFVQPRV